MFSSFRIGRIAGIPIGIHWSLLLVAWLVTANVADGPLAGPGRDVSPGQAILLGLGVAVAFIAAVLAHEVGHALMARRHAIPVEGIELWALGGVARFGTEAPSPRAEWQVAAAGPAVSLACAALFGGAAFGWHEIVDGTVVPSALAWLSAVNVILAAFNLLPAAPLDGGRILMAVLWRRHGDRVRATDTVSVLGQVLGWLMVGLGGALVLRGQPGFLYALLGWFLLTSAKASSRAAHMRAQLGRVRVADVSWFGIARAPESTDAGTMLWERQRLGLPRMVAVERADGTISGVVWEDQLWAIPEERRWDVTLRDLAVPIERTVRAAPDELLADAVARLNPLAPLITVWDGGHLVGVADTEKLRRRLEGMSSLMATT